MDSDAHETMPPSSRKQEASHLFHSLGQEAYASNTCGMLTMRNQSWKVGWTLRSHLRKTPISYPTFTPLPLVDGNLERRHFRPHRGVAAPAYVAFGIFCLYSWTPCEAPTTCAVLSPGQLFLVPQARHALSHFLFFAWNALALLTHLEASCSGFQAQLKPCFPWEASTDPGCLVSSMQL